MPRISDSSTSSLEDDDFEATVQEPEVNFELVEKIKAQALIDAGMIEYDEDGRTLANPRLLQAAVLQAMLSNHVASNKRELPTRASTKFELYAELLPRGPGVQALADGLEERLAQDQLMRNIWGFTNIGTSGFVQKNVAEEGFVLCEAEVSRTKINQETSKKEPTTERARFLTTDRDLILTYYTAPAGAAFLRAARRLEAQLGMVGARRPELTVPIAKQLGVVVRQAVGSVPHADVKQAAALTSGETESDAG
jgi:hypothetical protein